MYEVFIKESYGLLRVMIALLLGFCIGIERKMRYKEAGMRTHAIVAGGASLIMVVSKYGFGDIAHYDASRIAAQIVTGIGFLGAGIILYKREALHGLTTAAGIWMTAGIGMAVGAGMYILGVGATIAIIVLQWILHLRVKIFEVKKFYVLRLKFSCSGAENETVKQLFDVKRFSKISFYNDEKGLTASADIKTDRFIKDDDIKKIMLENPFIRSVERVED